MEIRGQALPRRFDEVLEWLIETARGYADDKGKPLTGETRVREIGMDSFGLVELMFQAEERYGIELDLNANNTNLDDKTLDEIARWITDLPRT